MKYFKKNKKKQKGFVLLIAVIISSLLASIGIFISTVATKELMLSVSAKTTQRAFFAADSAIECALYQDIRVQQFKINTADVSAPVEIPCNDDGSMTNVLKMLPSESSSGSDWAISVFEGSLATDQTDLEAVEKSGYVRIKVRKEKIGTVEDKTIIEAWGHNRKGLNGVVERALKVQY